MSYQWSIHSHLVHVRWDGVLVQEDVDAFLQEVPRLALQLGYLPAVLHTFDEVHMLQLSMPVPGSRLSRSRFPFALRGCRTALVVNRPLLHGIQHLFRALPGGPALELQVFHQRSDALDWLLSEKIEADLNPAQA